METGIIDNKKRQLPQGFGITEADWILFPQQRQAIPLAAIFFSLYKATIKVR